MVYSFNQCPEVIWPGNEFYIGTFDKCSVASVMGNRTPIGECPVSFPQTYGWSDAQRGRYDFGTAGHAKPPFAMKANTSVCKGFAFREHPWC